MILLYHKVAEENKTYWWVSADTFYRQMVQLAGKQVIYLDDYDPKNPNHVVITFDGIYENVLRYAAPTLKKFNYPFELFVTGDTIGKTNEFDKSEPLCDFAREATLRQLVKMGGRLQWHTKTHRDITSLSDKEVESEVIAPKQLQTLDPSGFKWFAYAYGKYDSRSQKIVKATYSGGLACDNGTFKDKTIWPRLVVSEDTQLIKQKVSVAITSYNYGHFLVEAIESVLRQTYLPDEIILSDDASSDHGYEIMKVYAKKYPNLIKINRNIKNLGIENHFNKVVRMSHGDFICFLGADNRFPSHYVEQCLIALLQDEKSAISYTDFALFGSRAEEVQRTFLDEDKGEQLANGVFLIKFPSFTPKSKKRLLDGKNFINGSSMYRRKAYNEAGGYPSRKEGPEDYSLFKAMVVNGWGASKVLGVYLEYRQHSLEQANMQFSYFGELSFLRQQFTEAASKEQDLQKLRNDLETMRKDRDKLVHNYKMANDDLADALDKVTNSRAWKIARLMQLTSFSVKNPADAFQKLLHIFRGQK